MADKPPKKPEETKETGKGAPPPAKSEQPGASGGAGEKKKGRGRLGPRKSKKEGEKEEGETPAEAGGEPKDDKKLLGTGSSDEGAESREPQKPEKPKPTLPITLEPGDIDQDKIRALAIPERKVVGKRGREIHLQANYLKVHLPKDKTIRVHVYRVVCFPGTVDQFTSLRKIMHTRCERFGNPPLDPLIPREQCRNIFWGIARAAPEVFGTRQQLYDLVYDSQFMLFSTRKLNITGPNDSQTIERKVFNHWENREVNSMLEITYAGNSVEISLPAIQTPTAAGSFGRNPLQVLEALLQQSKNVPYEDLAPNHAAFHVEGRGVYAVPTEQEEQRLIDLGGGLRAWNGYFAAMVAGRDKDRNPQLLLNVDLLVSGFLYSGMHLMDLFLGVNNLCGMPVTPTTAFMEEHYNNLYKGFGGKLKVMYKSHNKDGQPIQDVRIFKGFGKIPREEKFERRIPLPGKNGKRSRSRSQSRGRTNGAPDNGGRGEGNGEANGAVGGNGEANGGSGEANGAARGKETQRGKKETISVYQYRVEADRPIKHPEIRVVKLGRIGDRSKQARNKDIAVPLEECWVYQPQKWTGKLNESQTAAIIKGAALTPAARKERIIALLTKANLQQDKWLGRWNMTLQANLLDVFGRVLGPPEIVYRNKRTGSQDVKAQVRDGSWKIPGNAMCAEPTKEIVGISVLYFNEKMGRRVTYEDQAYFRNSQSYQQLGNYAYTLLKTMKEFGITLGPGAQEFKTVIGLSQEDDIPAAIKRIKEEGSRQGGVNLLLCVVQKKMGDPAYEIIKRTAEVKDYQDADWEGIMTQCCTEKTMKDNKQMTAANISLKICMKMGGICHYLIMPEVVNSYLNGATLVLGLDLIHPGGEGARPRGTVRVEDKKRHPSIAAVVGNMDRKGCVWMPTMRVQKRRREHIVYLEEAVFQRLTEYYKSTSLKPTRILVYRDGVSEGDFRRVLYEELNSIRQACVRMGTDKDPYKPTITYLVAQKRHHSKLFVKNARDGVGKGGNVPPGTTVDTGITGHLNADFFQVAHYGIQGTSKPIHYYILHDDNDFDADDLYEMTYSLCHQFARCTRSVSIPAPIYYADIACERGRIHFGGKKFDASSTSVSDTKPPTTTSPVSSGEGEEGSTKAEGGDADSAVTEASSGSGGTTESSEETDVDTEEAREALKERLVSKPWPELTATDHMYLRKAMTGQDYPEDSDPVDSELLEKVMVLRSITDTGMYYV